MRLSQKLSHGLPIRESAPTLSASEACESFAICAFFRRAVTPVPIEGNGMAGRRGSDDMPSRASVTYLWMAPAGLRRGLISVPALRRYARNGSTTEGPVS